MLCIEPARSDKWRRSADDDNSFRISDKIFKRLRLGPNSDELDVE